MVEPSSEALYALGGTRLAARDFSGAVAAYQAAMRASAPGAALLNNLGVALLGTGQLEAAQAVFEQALSLEPAYLRALVNLGKVLGMRGLLGDAQTVLQRALAQSPDYVPALLNLGDVQGAAGSYEDAARSLRRAIHLAPRSAEAQRCLGMALTRVGQTYDAIAALEAAVALQPASADNHTSLAQLLLLEGRWTEAWPHFEFRLQRSRHALPADLAATARWDGGDLGGRALWLVGEQGLGDQIQFARYARVLRERGVHCVLACDAKLVALLRKADLANDTVPLGTRFDAISDRWLPLLSTPAWHGTVPTRVPLPDGYLQADLDRVAAWGSRLGAPEGLRVAFAWQGNPAMETGWFAGRSPPLGALAPLWAVDGVQYVSLQKGPAALGLRDLHVGPQLRALDAFDEGPDAFLDSAAILQCVDLLVTSDSALAHLAGALGIECWVCLPAHPDWRWLRDTARSPWYASLQVFRQIRPGDWTSVFAQVAGALRTRARERHALRAPAE